MRSWCAPLLVVASLVAAPLLAPTPAVAFAGAEVRVEALPKEARVVLAQIHDGGPFRYERDGVVFGNRERLLPSERRGYYHEYTVPTPGARNRGARRIVCGGPKQQPVACWYTDDHYQSFAKIRE
ncbi:MAG: ribonuclease [Burkholderiales bacterium]|nr:ribonuclease [Burkholderiales bacterium]